MRLEHPENRYIKGVLEHQLHIGEFQLNANNQQLQAILQTYGLTQTRALELCNLGMQKPIQLSTWKSYFCKPETKRYRNCPDLVITQLTEVIGSLGLTPIQK